MEMGTKAGAEAGTVLGARAGCVPRAGALTLALTGSRFNIRSGSSRRSAVLREEINLNLTLLISIDTIKYDCIVIVWE